MVEEQLDLTNLPCVKHLQSAALMLTLFVFAFWFMIGGNLWLLGYLIGAGFVVKHMAYILMKGYLFNELRTGIELKRQNYFFNKLHVLFSCNLCMTAQLSIWVIAVPSSVIFCLRYPHAFSAITGVQLYWVLEWALVALTTFLLGMLISAIAMLIWRIVEFPGELISTLSTYNQQWLDLKRASLSSISNKEDVEFTFEEE